MKEEWLKVFMIKIRKYNSYKWEISPAVPKTSMRIGQIKNGLQILQNFIFLPARFTFRQFVTVSTIYLLPGQSEHRRMRNW